MSSMRIEEKKLPDHRHCDVCEWPRQKYHICDDCYIVMCPDCHEEAAEWILDSHPCAWVQWKLERYEKNL